jgi:hypothetical protein
MRNPKADKPSILSKTSLGIRILRIARIFFIRFKICKDQKIRALFHFRAPKLPWPAAGQALLFL